MTARVGRAFLLPALVILFAIDLLPLLYSAWVSAHDWWLLRPRDVRFVGVANYLRLAGDGESWRAVAVTALFTVGAVVVEFLAGLGLALLFAQPFRFLRAVRVLLLLPLFVVPVVGATMWRVIFHPELGVLNYYLGRLGLGEPPWLADPTLALVSVTLVDAWRAIPFMFLVLHAGLQTLPGEVFEAAAVDGASRWQSFRHVTLPLLAYVMLVALLIRAMDAFREFDLIFVLTAGGPGTATQTIQLLEYRLFGLGHMGQANAVGIVTVGLVALLCLGLVRGIRPPRRALATGALLVPVLAWTLFPIYWLAAASLKTELGLYARPPQWLFTPILDNYRRVLSSIPFLRYLANSLVVAIGTTLGGLVLGGLAGYAFARVSFRGAGAVRFLVLVTRMAPRMVLVVPYYLLMQRLGLLDTYTGLLLAYVSFALPFTIWLLIGFFADVPLEVEEAARLDGCGPLGVLLRVVVPVAAPGLVVAAIFAFLVSWNEFLFALILTGVETKTLPVVIAGFSTDVGPLYGEMSAAAVMVMLPNVVMTLGLERYLVRGLALGAVAR